jgi:hypothetical protein
VEERETTRRCGANVLAFVFSIAFLLMGAFALVQERITGAPETLFPPTALFGMAMMGFLGAGLVD